MSDQCWTDVDAPLSDTGASSVRKIDVRHKNWVVLLWNLAAWTGGSGGASFYQTKIFLSNCLIQRRWEAHCWTLD
jgi:hypothetical protein